MYRRLANWDAFHYLSIARHGYRRTENPNVVSIYSYQDNAAFFPGFPLLAGLAMRALPSIPPEITLILTAQVMGLLGWLYFLLLLSPEGSAWTPRRERLVLAALLYPSAFYLIMPYSESTFLVALLGMAYFWDLSCNRSHLRPGLRAFFFLLAAVHGALLSATRLVGLPVAVLVPLLVAALNWRKPGIALPTAALALPGAAGFLAFLAHLQAKFGDWAWGFHINSIGWKNDFSLKGLFDWATYRPLRDPGSSANVFSRWCVPVFLGLAVSWGIYLIRRYRLFKRLQEENARALLWLSLAAGGAFFTAFIGKVSQQSIGMMRYTLPVYLIVLICAERCPDWRPLGRLGDSPRWRQAATAFLIILQFHFIYRYVQGLWVT
jgi:hypothetical protein